MLQTLFVLYRMFAVVFGVVSDRRGRRLDTSVRAAGLTLARRPDR